MIYITLFFGAVYTNTQIIGTAIGIHHAPPYANLFLADIDEQILKFSNNNFDSLVKAWKRFLR